MPTPHRDYSNIINGPYTYTQDASPGHKGVDLAAAQGTPVKASIDGTVVFSGTETNKNTGQLVGYGNYVIIQHVYDDGSQILTLYAHLYEPSELKLGDQVDAGAYVGGVGNTGRYTGPTGMHLHYEERYIPAGAADGLTSEQLRQYYLNKAQVLNPDKGSPLDPATPPGTPLRPYGKDSSGQIVPSSSGLGINDPSNPMYPPGGYDRTRDPDAWADLGAAATTPRTYDPLILDLDGDGIETTAVNRYGAHFDMDGNGFAESVGWASADDGILVRDLNADGVINDGSELFGDHTVLKNGQTAANGFAALADLDDNGDGKTDMAKIRMVNPELSL